MSRTLSRARGLSGETKTDREGSRVTAVDDAQFAENIGDMLTDGQRADEELLGNFQVGQALAEQAEDFPFTARQSGKRLDLLAAPANSH